MSRKSNNDDTFNDKNRLIFLSGSINESKAEDVINKLLLYDASSPKTDILLVVDSYGGYVDSFIAIHDVIKMLTSNVVTICIGKAMSCGQMILISGTKGKRFMTPNSRVMIHEVSGFSGGKLTDIEIDYKETLRLQKQIIEKLILKYTKITQKQLDEFMSADTFLSANECIKYGIVDHIITAPGILYNRIK